MGKSSKKKRREKRKRDLEKLRGTSILDEECSPIRPLGSTPNPLRSQHLAPHATSLLSSEENEIDQKDNTGEGHTVPSSDSMLSQRKRIEFVLPQSNGRAEPFIFDKPLPATKTTLSAISEHHADGGTGMEPNRMSEETLEDILFLTKRRRLADKFEAVHRAEETKKGVQEELDETSIVETNAETPTAPVKKTKRKGIGSKILDMDERTEDSVTTSVTGASLDSSNQQLSGRSVEQAVEDRHGLRPRANSTDGELNLPQRGLCDEQMVLQSHKWHDKHTFPRHSTPRGLNNLGNTCFLSSILQCLAYSPPFCQSLIAISDMKGNQLKGERKFKQNHGQKITASLSRLFQRVHGFSGEASNERSVSPQAIVQMLPKLGSIGSRNGYKFWPGRQEDAHEFLVHLLDAMHDGELRGAGINQHLSGWRDRLPVTRLDETTFIHRIFGGYFRSQVRCKACGYCSNTYDPFMDLSLEVSKKSSSSILHALGEFTRKETLDAANRWKCSGCKKHVCPTKQLTVFRAPLCLCIQLKRFSFDSGYGGFGGGRSTFGGTSPFSGRSKITKPIQFPADLSLPLSDGRSCAYSLTGVVIHVGGNASSGHYTAYVKQPGKQGKNQWYHADDSFVEPVSEETVLRQKDAYVLFYCRKEVRLEFPSLPPRDMSTEEAQEFGRARARARADSSGADEARSPSFTSSPAIHPLAALLNKSISEQVKSGLSPATKSIEASMIDSSASNAGLHSQSPDRGDSESKVEAFKPPSEARQVVAPISTAIVEQERQTTPPPQTVDKQEDVHSSEGVDASSHASSSSETEGSSDFEEPKVGPSTSTPLHAEIQPAQSTTNTQNSMLSSESPRKLAAAENAGGSTGASSSSKSESGNVKAKKAGTAIEASEVQKPTNLGAADQPGIETKARVVVGSSDSRAKVTVVMGPRKKKAWVPKTFATTQKGAEFQLLGNLGVSTWADEEQESTAPKPKDGAKPEQHSSATAAREAIVQKMEKDEKSRKRKTHLDRWDSILDQGRTKKVKTNGGAESTAFASNDPKKNAFQRIQAGIQRMNKGKAKGLFRRKGNDGKGIEKRKGRS